MSWASGWPVEPSISSPKFASSAAEIIPSGKWNVSNAPLSSAARTAGAEVRERKPDLRVASVRGRGHAPLLDEQEAVDAIETFLERF